jgi:hypothetical protein
MRSHCIPWPENEPLILMRASQLQICDGNHCAAALMSFFQYWHEIQMGKQEQAHHANTIALRHGDPATQDTSLLQFHTEAQIEEGLLHLYGRKMTRQGIAKLIEKGFLSLHKNPNPRYRFDQTHYFLFHPDTVIKELQQSVHAAELPERNEAQEDQNAEQYELEIEQESPQVIEIVDEAKMPHASGQNAAPSGKNAATRKEITEREEDKDLFSAVDTAEVPEDNAGIRANGRTPPEPYSKGFCDFYCLYPTKREKDNAWKVWKALKLEPYTERICASVRDHQTEDRQWRDGFIPYPAKFLRNGAWKDDLAASQVQPRRRRVAL